MTFTLGKQHFAPISYNNFEVGPFEVTLAPRQIKGDHLCQETYGEMLARATPILEDMFDIEFERTMNKFFDRMERMGKIVKARSKR